MNSNWSYSLETPNLGQFRQFLAPCDLEIWRMTLKNNRAPVLSNIKLYASFHHHMWIQTGVAVRKRLSWVLTSVTLTFDLWPWPLTWTLFWSMVITPEKLECGTWYHHPRRLQCVLSRNLIIFNVATWHYRCRHNLKNNCIWDNLQCCLLMPRSPSKPVMMTFDLQSRKVLFIEIVFWHV